MIRYRQARWLYHRLRQIGLRTINVRARLGIRNHVDITRPPRSQHGIR